MRLAVTARESGKDDLIILLIKIYIIGYSSMKECLAIIKRYDMNQTSPKFYDDSL